MQNEIDVMSKIDHPSIVKYYRHLEDEKQVFFLNLKKRFILYRNCVAKNRYQNMLEPQKIKD